jgi:hypothetical protein
LDATRNFAGAHDERFRDGGRGQHHQPQSSANVRVRRNDLALGAKIYLIKQSGRVTAILTATDYPRSGIRWIEINDNLSLQNLLVSLFRELHVRLNIGGL